MMVLKRADEILVPRLEMAKSLRQRAVGLLGRRGLDDGQALWIPRCGSIHTFFMKFTIDLIFVNKDLVVVKTVQRLRPWRIVPPVWKASSVFELQGGFLEKHPVAIGEQLHVDSALS